MKETGLWASAIALAGGVTVLVVNFSFTLLATNTNVLLKPQTQLAAIGSLSTLSDRVVLTTANGTYEFLKSEAVDKGTYVSPDAGFSQRNLCDTNPLLPHMSVCFRPDADGSRDEVVFEYGTFMQTPVDLGAYSVAFYKGTQQLGTSSVPKHVFYQRWRWLPDGYRPRYRTVADLEVAWLLPPLRTAFAFKANPGSPPPLGYNVILSDKVGLTPYMGATGERGDLGFVTAWQADYILTQTEAWWQFILAQAEAGMSVPWNIRDEGGTPINMYRTAAEGATVNRLLLNLSLIHI